MLPFDIRHPSRDAVFDLHRKWQTVADIQAADHAIINTTNKLEKLFCFFFQAGTMRGAVYFLRSTLQSNVSLSTVTKLTPDGKAILWQNQLGFGASAIAVDSTGGVYVALTRLQSDTTGYIAKLSSTGTGLAWQMSVGFLPQSPISIATDSQGRVYFAAALSVNDSTANVARANAAGTALDFTTQINGNPTSIAFDPSGAAYVGGTGVNADGTTIGFLAQITSDGSPGY